MFTVHAIIGKRGTGKTALATTLAKESSRRKVVFCRTDSQKEKWKTINNIEIKPADIETLQAFLEEQMNKLAAHERCDMDVFFEDVSANRKLMFSPGFTSLIIQNRLFKANVYILVQHEKMLPLIIRTDPELVVTRL